MSLLQIVLSLPSPSIERFRIGPLTIHIYALCILTGVAAGWWLSRRRFLARGGRSEEMETIVTLAVLAGIIGARLYHVASDYQLYFGPGRNPIEALYVWRGGLGIWGGVLLGALAVWWYCRRKGYDFATMADVMAPGVLLAQGIGRLGNWFNQELFGRPSTLPWAVEIDPAKRPSGYADVATFHPTFLYEMVWALLGVGFLLWAERRFGLGRGKVFTLYVVFYCFGRFFIEALRIDPVNTPGGFRLNNYTSAVVFVGGLFVLLWQWRARPGVAEAPFEGAKPAMTAADKDADPLA